METNRDDFIIAVRSAFLKKNYKQRFSLIGLIFFSLLLLVLGKLNFTPVDYLRISLKEISYKSAFIVSVPENYIKNVARKIGSHFNLYENYLNIKSEIEKIKSEKILNEFIVAENIRLKKAIDDHYIKSEGVIGKVLIDKQSPFLKSIIINQGSKNKIKLGMAVVNNNYLVGKVVEVNYLTSRVLLLSDLNSKIPVILEPGSIRAILSGTGKNNGRVQYLKDKTKVSKNSVVYTSGSGGIFKAGIPIGKIKDPNLNNEIEVEFLAEFSQLDIVSIISFTKEAQTKAESEARTKIEREAQIKTETKAQIKAETKAQIKAEREVQIKAEREVQIKAEREAQIKISENVKNEALFKKLSKKYTIKCKKTFLNNLYVVGTPKFKACIMNKGIKKKKN